MTENNPIEKIKSLNDCHDYQSMQTDFVNTMFAEYIASDSFAKLDKEDKAEKFREYETLQMTLSVLSEVCTRKEALV